MVPSSSTPPPSPSSRSSRSHRVAAARLLVALLLGVALLAGAPGPAWGEGTADGGTADGGATAAGARWQWPLPPPHRVVAGFEAPAHRYGPGHRGIDVAAAAGTPVRAVEGGVVRFSGQLAGRGVVSVMHADGLISTFEPVTGQVAAGDAVTTGQLLGVMEGAERSHCPGTGCLHLGARRGAEYLDPMLLLGARGPSVLLPWAGVGPAVLGPRGASAA
ncbi:murein hydrolase activator EnvC family protein [Brachybacterium aquaticum]|uniref:Murein DD-endopeptidase MepM/ murein hydrolase activator NlpD n=1 Tax=Brachybacterium aquaticum TaxID=1432564 RepID=A0A841AFN6_9MICO|nr:M23 family metallopeptidase [Brachybacterium aquaticum]MBB5832072.1 murein DD-endopeptidase MepM/ murein hydrolase activator NlpD [Brachybacterium aquaticum]